jgi:hypothetical protein
VVAASKPGGRKPPHYHQKTGNSVQEIKMKKGLLVLIAVIVAIGLAAGSFYGGMAYQRNQTANTRAAFFASRGVSPNGTLTPGQGQGQGRGFFGGGASGQIKSIEGNVLTLSTAQNVTTVNLSKSTQIEKTGPGALSDLTPGLTVRVTGQPDANGNIAATSILIMPANLNNPANNPAGSPTATP